MLFYNHSINSVLVGLSELCQVDVFRYLLRIDEIFPSYQFPFLSW